MRKIYFALMIAMSAVISLHAETDSITPARKWTDISLFLAHTHYGGKVSHEKNKPIMWFSHEEVKYFVEARLNFDWDNTGMIGFGRTWSKSDKFWVTPKLGVLFSFAPGGYDGLSPEVNFGGRRDHFDYFLMNQVAISLREANPFFLYEYIQLGYDFKYFKINLGTQLYKEFRTGTDCYVDFGPQVFVPIQKFWIKPWVTIDPIHPIWKVVVGIGYHF